MKSSSLTLALAVAIMGTSGVAHAVTLNPRGLGQVLVYPYYTVNKNQDTLITVVNTTDIGKAIKVHFREGYNGRDVLYFNLFLSPQDVWTARISQTAGDGGAAIFTSDHSCTYPAIVPSGQPFRASGYTGGSFPPDGGPTSITRTREGSVELFEMGEIIRGSDLDDATRHVQHGTPGSGIPDCTQAVIGGNAAFAGLAIPGGGLFGTGAIVNVGEGTFFSYNADAIDGFSDTTLFSLSADPAPTLQYANNLASSSSGGAVAQVVNDRGTLISLDYANGVDAVSAIFMADSIYNEYLVADGLGANTDWIVNFPTRAFYTDPLYIGAGAALPPFFERVQAGISNVEIENTVFDQERGIPSPEDSFPGQPAPPFLLPYQVDVLRFAASSAPSSPSSVFGSTLTPGAIHPYGGAGWLRVDLASGDTIGHALRPDHAGKQLHGLPVIGFMAYNLVNANAAPGKLANYGGTFTHRASVSCTQSDAPQPLACH